MNRGSRETGAATVKRPLSAVRAYSATTTTGSVCGQDSSKEVGRGDKVREGTVVIVGGVVCGVCGERMADGDVGVLGER